MKTLVIVATTLTLFCSAPAFAGQWQPASVDGRESKPAPARSARRARVIGMLVGAGAGVGLGLVTGLQLLPEATCKDAKVWGMAGAFGTGGALAGYALTRSAQDPFAFRGPLPDRARTARRAEQDPGPLPTFLFRARSNED
jgi:hypothetical protein